jgi:hypothetical protein
MIDRVPRTYQAQRLATLACIDCGRETPWTCSACSRATCATCQVSYYAMCHPCRDAYRGPIHELGKRSDQFIRAELDQFMPSGLNG